MPTKATRPNKGTVTGHSWKALPTYQWLGTDRNDYHHVIDRKRDVVHRVDPRTGARERVTDLYAAGDTDRGDATETYVDFIADELGWADRILLARDIFGDAV